MTNETERPEDTVRRFARKLIRVEAMVDAELERVSKDDLRPAAWWEFRRRVWIEGVRAARRVTAQRLVAIKSAFYEDP